MSRPTRNASIIASQRITKILKPLRNSFENLTVDEPSTNEVPVVPVQVPVQEPYVIDQEPVEVPVVPVKVPVEVPIVPVEVPSTHETDIENPFEETSSFVWKPLTTSYQHTPESVSYTHLRAHETG
jgi:hypothetical protein